LENAVSIDSNASLSARASEDFLYHTAPQGLAATHSCRVLVVDDDPMVRKHLAEVLNASQYLVEVAATGAEALRIMDATHCHVVLTDWQMPDMDGLALCRHVRLKMQESYVYVLMLTIRNTRHDVLTAFAAGADAYVVKGAATNDLLARVEIGRRISHGEYAKATKNRDDWGLSYKDPVTGALSLDYLMHHLPRELIRSQRYGHALGVLSCKIDGFNRFTDQFGHEAGDEQLRSFVAAAEGCIRKSDWLARTVGDSFIIVLPETAAAGAHRAAQKLRALFALHPLSTPLEPIGFTVSIDVTALEGQHDDDSAARLDALMRSANCGADIQPISVASHANPDTIPEAMGSDLPGRGKNELN
jgi:diguanylate cyclase (GGDEF)-like protein